MADDLGRAHDTLRTVPDFAVLSEIADRLGTSFAIRGGVPRNLLARSVREDDRAVRSLADLVDPFSDIDLVVQEPAVATALLLRIHSAIAVAGFFRWELKERSRVERSAKTEARTTLDGVEIVFQPGKPPELANHEAAAHSLATRDLLAVIPHRRSHGEHRFDRMESDILALRVARFAAQFDLRFPLSILGEPSWQREAELEPPISPYAEAMLRFAALDVLFTAESRRLAVLWLSEIERYVSGAARQSVFAVRDLADAYPAAYAVAYPGREEVAPMAQTGIAGAPGDVIDDESSALPWIPVQLPPGSADCCGGDFTLGPLAIAWRGLDPVRAEPEVDLGPVILLPSGDRDDPEPFVFAAPGIVDRHRSTVMRLDWGFARLIAGGGKTVFVGARPTAQAEGGS